MPVPDPNVFYGTTSTAATEVTSRFGKKELDELYREVFKSVNDSNDTEDNTPLLERKIDSII